MVFPRTHVNMHGYNSCLTASEMKSYNGANQLKTLIITGVDDAMGVAHTCT